MECLSISNGLESLFIKYSSLWTDQCIRVFESQISEYQWIAILNWSSQLFGSNGVKEWIDSLIEIHERVLTIDSIGLLLIDVVTLLISLFKTQAS